MKRYKKYRILGVGFLLLIVVSLALLAPTYVVKADEQKNENTTRTELTCEELAQKYGLSIYKENDRYYVKRELAYACGGESTATVKLQLINKNGLPVENGPILEGETTKIEITDVPAPKERIEEVVVENNKTVSLIIQYVTITFQNVDNKSEIIDIYYEIENTESQTRMNSEANTNYHGICASFRQEVEAMDETSINYYKAAVSYCWNPMVPKGTNYEPEELQNKIDNAKKSWESFTTIKEQATPEFMSEFNRIKENAYKFEATNVILDGDNVPDKTFNLKCAYNYLPDADLAPYTNKYGEIIDKDGDITDSAGNVLVSDEENSYSYLNKDYYYSVKTDNEGEIEYTYNYAPGNTQTVTQTNVCKRTCEESVKVEYGPPVASKAGLCFEYQVKVTSYVVCDSSFEAKAPSTTTDYCNPGITCVTSKGAVQSKPQAGPTEDYEACILACDGGKYTQKCSVKCYNEVYADTDNKKIKLALNYEDAMVRKLGDNITYGYNDEEYSVEQCIDENIKEDEYNYYGCYAYSGRTYNDDGTVKNSGTISWNSGETYGACNKDYAGRWYIDSQYFNWANICDWTVYGSKAYIIDQQGFVRGQYGTADNHSTCSDNCTWKHDCDGKYLNPGSAIEDYKRNQEEYEAARNTCTGAATCSSRTGTFTISINYKTNEKDVTVDFPYSSIDKDSISSKGNNNEGKDTSVDKYSTILQRKGCYEQGPNNNKYLVEWSFPGTYIHNKNGDISFEVPSDTSGWYLEDNKFCMPLNAKSVNTKWWEWAVRKNDCYTADQIQNELKYNINASTNNFGYFGWNINISCFYALRNEICDVTKSDECCPTVPECENPPCDKCENPPCDSTINYMVRSVDRQNLFPNAAAEGTVDENTRKIGFNWTPRAATSKNSNYVIDPGTLITDIETNANLLYSDDNKYLDYQFYLTPESLRKIRNYNKDHPYGEWSGETKLVNGINAYSSNVFRSTGSNSNIISGDAVIKTGEIGVNNQ